VDKLLGSTGLGVTAIGVGLLRAKGHGTLGLVVLAIGILMLIAAFVIAFKEHRPPGITVNAPLRKAGTAIQFKLSDGRHALGPSYASLAVPVACTRKRLDNLRAEVAFTGLRGGNKVTTRGRWDGAEQPKAPFGDWTRFDRITLLKGDDDHLSIAMQYDDDGSLWALDPRSWKAHLEQGRPDLRAQGYRLDPVGERTSVTVTLRADGLADKRHAYDLVMIGTEWMLKRQGDASHEPAIPVAAPAEPPPAIEQPPTESPLDPAAEEERRREQRESSYVLSLEPANHMQWSRHHQDVNQVVEMVVHLTNHGRVDSPPVTIFALIDGEHAGQSRPTAANAGRREDALIKLDFKRRGDVQPQPVGQGVLTLLAMAGPDGTRKLAEWPPAAEEGSAPEPPTQVQHARLLTTLGKWRSDANTVDLDYRIDNASDYRAWDVAVGFGKPDRSRLGTPERVAMLNPGDHADVTITLARSLYNATDDLRLVINWSDEAGGGLEERRLGEPGKLPIRQV
jgi:hypothetical protein